MKKELILALFLLAVLCACTTQRMICPAYQSSFIYDKEALKKKFSYFKEDSTPKLFTASTSKNRYLVAVPESYRKKLKSLQTVEMKPVYPVIPDSLTFETEFSIAEKNNTDSATLDEPSKGLDPSDSAYAITKTKEKYNIEQDNYMWYFRNILVLPDVRAAIEEKKNGKKQQNEEEVGLKKKENFFKRLSRKKSKDSTSVNAPHIEEGDSTASVESEPMEKPRKGLFKKKETAQKKSQSVKKQLDAKKDEDEDDGF